MCPCQAARRQTKGNADGLLATRNMNHTKPIGDETMLNLIKNFRNDESGAVTVDWVVLTAAVIALGIAAYSAIEGTATTMNKASDAEVAGFAKEIFSKGTNGSTQP